ncbi:hypothetical protein GX411_03020, partial [Candidatus Fermentibacteria bacterium]|nr:hypothetical protein [Candidatus Fermentibacteria bacterium]
MKGIAAAVSMVCLAGVSDAAFEPVQQSPWAQGGCASTLFPRSALDVIYNPALAGAFDGFHAAASYGRPFGLSRLDRGAVAGVLPMRSIAPAAFISASGDESYSELQFAASAAWRCAPGFVLGLGACLQHLSIEDYGASSGFSLDAGLVFTPLRGVQAASSVRGALRSELGESGDPSVPRSFDLAAGVRPVERLLVSAGLSRQEGFDPEYCFAVSFSPPGPATIGIGCLTDPGRFGVSVSIGLGGMQFLYGLATHPSLDPTHSAGISWGSPFTPPPADGGAGEPTPGPGSPPFDPNTATLEQLCTIPGIG